MAPTRSSSGSTTLVQSSTQQLLLQQLYSNGLHLALNVHTRKEDGINYIISNYVKKNLGG
jgi:hypothetical protein